jgi:hypothetical protein
VKGEEMEIDILAPARRDDKEVLIAIECATYLRERDVEALSRKLKKFYHFFPEYKDRELIGAVGYVYRDEKAMELAQQERFYIISIGDNVMELKNEEGFLPKVYRYEG